MPISSPRNIDSQRQMLTRRPTAGKKWSHNFCPVCGCGTFSDSPDFKPDGSWDGKAWRIGANALLFDNFDAAAAPVKVIDGKHLW